MYYEENGIVFDQEWSKDQNGVWTIPCLVLGHRVNFHINPNVLAEEKRKFVEQMAVTFFVRIGSSIVFDTNAYQLWRDQVKQGRSFEKFFCYTDMHQVLMKVIDEYHLQDQISFPKIFLIDNNMLQCAIERIVGKDELEQLTNEIDTLVCETRQRLQSIIKKSKI